MTGDELSAWMRIHEPSVTRLAERLGVSRRTVHYWLNGRSPIPRLAEIAIAGLEFDLDALVRERADQTSPNYR